MKQQVVALVSVASICLVPALADAHISIASGPAFANTTQEISFGVGHGCEGSDTYSVRIEIPAGVTSVRALTSDFGRATVEKDAAQNVVAVSWTKPVEDVIPGDDNYYKLVLRFKVPDKPFTTLHFPTHQTCRTADGGTLTTDWVAVEETDGGAEPAPVLKIVPARRAGWNKWTVPNDIADLAVFFSDAQIVWKDNQAYSANPTTAELIGSTPDVEALSELAAGDEIWVKY